MSLGCGDDDSCPDGFVCTKADSGADTHGDTDAGPDDSTVDGGADATLPCGVECNGVSPLCDTELMECVQCLAPADCAGMGDATMCSDAGSCVECLGSSDCDEPGASVCATDGDMAGTCVPCATATSATDCAGMH